MPVDYGLLPIDKRAEDAAAEMDELGKRYAGRISDVVSMSDECEETCKRFGLASVKKVMCQKTLTHPENRWGVMLEASDVLVLAGEIVQQGFSWSELRHAKAFLIDPAERKNIEAENQKVADDSGGILPSIVAGQGEITTVTCSHFCASGRCIKAKMPCKDERVSEEGCFSENKISSQSPQYGIALREGIDFLCFYEVVEKRWPWTVNLFMEADNMRGKVNKPDTPPQVARVCGWVHGWMHAHV